MTEVGILGGRFTNVLPSRRRAYSHHPPLLPVFIIIGFSTDAVRLLQGVLDRIGRLSPAPS